MAYTEINLRDNRKYYYRVLSVRAGKKISKKRIYLGVNLSQSETKVKELEADKKIKEDKINRTLAPIKKVIISILKSYNVKKAGIFGSYARGENTKKSDIDIIIEPPKGMGYDFVGLALDLEKKLKKKVDLLSYNGISPYFKKSILEDEVPII
ncbi:MAG: nucleotidyltransferase domain-containing protein [Nanoarchaeota archaeon]